MAGDPNYNNVSLLLHANGANGSTTFTDNSPTPKTVTPINATISNAADAFGTTNGVAYFTGSNSYLEVADNAAFRVGSGDFTIEAWVNFWGYPNNNTGDYSSAITAKDTSSGRELLLLATGTASSFTTLNFYAFTSPSDYDLLSGAFAFQLNTWYHIAVVRSGNNCKLFVNGNVINGGGAGQTLNRTVTGSVSPLRVGASAFSGAYSYYSKARIDDYRFTKGVAVYTANFTPPTTELPHFLADNYTLSLSTQIKTFETYSKSLGITLNTFQPYALSLGTSIDVRDTYIRSLSTQIKTFETYTLSLSTSIRTAFSINHPITIETYQPFTLSLGTSVVVQEHVLPGGEIVTRLRLPITIVIKSEFTLSQSITIETLSMNQRLSLPIVIATYENYIKSLPLSIDVKHPSYSRSLATQIKTFETFTLSLGVTIQVFPVFTGGIGGQGVGQLVALPTNNSQRWTLKATLAGVDISARLTGQANIDAEETSAMVCTFSIRPADGLVNPYQWVKAPIDIAYVDSDTGVVYPLFHGIVDNPNYDTTSRLTEFTGTDNLQNVVRNLTHSQVAEITPAAKWSRFVFDETVDSWDYLQDRLSTFTYGVQIDETGRLFAYNYQSALVLYEFTANTVIEGSLSISLANAREITNQYNVSLDTQFDKYRETVIRMRWQDQRYDVYYPSWNMCDAQWVPDAISGAGGTLVQDPLFGIEQETHSKHYVDGYGVAVNYGVGLFAQEFKGVFSKRYTQSVVQHNAFTVRDSSSIAQLGILQDDLSSAIQVEYNTTLDEAFQRVANNTKWLCSAGVGLQAPREESLNTYFDPLLFISDGTHSGFVPYPMIPITYETWDQSGTLLQGINALRYSLDSQGNIVAQDGSFGTPGSASPGEYLYNFDAFILQGTAAEQTTAKETLVAQATQSILSSHRQNRVSFSTFINPHIKRGQTLRVSTPTLIATGVVYQVSHAFNIEDGSAITNITLAISSSKAIGLTDTVVNNIKLSLPIQIEVIDGKVQGHLPMDQTTLLYDLDLSTDYSVEGAANYTFDAHHWGGYFTGAYNPSNQEFALQFPELPIANTANAEITIQNGIIDVHVPNDELLILA